MKISPHAVKMIPEKVYESAKLTGGDSYMRIIVAVQNYYITQNMCSNLLFSSMKGQLAFHGSGFDHHMVIPKSKPPDISFVTRAAKLHLLNHYIHSL